jgi:hypothetical protein
MVTEEPALPTAKTEAPPSERMPSRLLRGLAPLGTRAKASVRAWIRSGNAAPALLPLIIALPTLWWFLTDMRVAAQTAAGRDQGIFQFIGWSMLKGERLYRDIRDVSGPITAYIHMAIQLIGGRGEHALRVGDLLVTSVVFFASGSLLVGCTLPRQVDLSRRFVQRVTWGLAAWVILGTQYLGINYDYWTITQRESFGDWFVLTSVALQIWAQARSAAEERERFAGIMLALSAGLSVTVWFCKPTFFLFTVAQMVALVADKEMHLKLTRRLRWAVIGATAGGTLQLILLLIFGSVPGFFATMFGEVPRLFVYLWPQPLVDQFGGNWATLFAIAMTSTTTLIVLIIAGEIPRRALGLALAPLAAIASVLIQRKGVWYHYHPLLATVHLQFIFGCLWLSERFFSSSFRESRAEAPADGSAVGRSRTFERLLAVAAATALGLSGVNDATKGYFFKNRDLIRLYEGKPEPRDDAFLHRFDNGSYGRADLEAAARYIQQKVPLKGRLFYWGMDPYLMFLAQRLNATSYPYCYHLNPGAVLAGGADMVPSEAKKAEINAAWAANARDLTAQLKAKPPAALAIQDGLYWGPDGYADFKKWCPDAAAFLDQRFKEVTRFGNVRIFLPRS